MGGRVACDVHVHGKYSGCESRLRGAFSEQREYGEDEGWRGGEIHDNGFRMGKGNKERE